MCYCNQMYPKACISISRRKVYSSPDFTGMTLRGESSPRVGAHSAECLTSAHIQGSLLRDRAAQPCHWLTHLPAT